MSACHSDGLAQAAAPAPSPCGIVIFGASGDLAARKLMPALHRLYEQGALHERSYILGAGRAALNDAAFREQLGAASLDGSFLRRCFFQSMKYEQLTDYAALTARLVDLDRMHGAAPRRMFYLATPPDVAQTIAERLGLSGLSQERDGGWSRVVLEKPFGRDLSSAQHMNAVLRTAFEESQIYRIDHYLGKETVQNLLVFRFANSIFEPIWNRNYIDNVQISVAESDGVGRRAGYFDRTGLLRDMVQNHLLQLLCLTAMEAPCTMTECFMRDEKTKVLAAIAPFSPLTASSNVVRGQYARGRVGVEEVASYLDEAGVAPNSTTETYVAMRLEIDNWRWKGVPFYLRAGKRLARRSSHIVVQFKSPPAAVLQPLMLAHLTPNLLHFQLQPSEGIQLRFETKAPGSPLQIKTAALQFEYSNAFGSPPPDAYARLLLDVITGDMTLFLRQDWIEHAWAVLAPLLGQVASETTRTLPYTAGSWGPKAADELVNREGRGWVEVT